MTNNIRKALKVFADLGVGSGPDHETETYQIERGAIRNARAALETADAADDEEPLSARDLAMIDQAWENHKAALPVATVIDDNQPGRTAIIEITIDPPTLPVGTKLYIGPKMVELAAETSLGDVVAMKEASPPDWLWWGEVAGKDVVTFGRGPKRGARWCYKLADIQPTEHDRLDVRAEAKSQEPVAVAWRRRRKGIVGNGGWIMCPEYPGRDREFDLEHLYTHPTKPEAPAVSVSRRLEQVAKVMRSARNNKKQMDVWADDVKIVEDAIAALIAGER